MFRAFNKGFQIDFPNGYTVSVMFGEGNYCENRDKPSGTSTESRNAEIVVWCTSIQLDVYNDKIGGNNGWRSPLEIAAVIHAVSSHNGTDLQLTQKIADILRL